MKKRKPRLNSNTSSIMPYRYVNIKVQSVKKVDDGDGFTCKYEMTYTIDENDYYYEKYGDELFRKEYSAFVTDAYYEVGKVYREPFTIDID